MKSCFLFGHRDAPSEIRTRMEEAVERHYQEYGIRQFYVGGYGAFDSMAASAVKDAKMRLPRKRRHATRRHGRQSGCSYIACLRSRIWQKRPARRKNIFRLAGRLQKHAICKIRPCF